MTGTEMFININLQAQIQYKSKIRTENCKFKHGCRIVKKVHRLTMYTSQWNTEKNLKRQKSGRWKGLAFPEKV